MLYKYFVGCSDVCCLKNVDFDELYEFLQNVYQWMNYLKSQNACREMEEKECVVRFYCELCRSFAHTKIMLRVVRQHQQNCKHTKKKFQLVQNSEVFVSHQIYKQTISKWIQPKEFFKWYPQTMLVYNEKPKKKNLQFSFFFCKKMWIILLMNCGREVVVLKYIIKNAF